ncbi:MAG: hypothetical protein EOO50_00085 [Flavobacterium sp.]|uniref:hypothetical protein n=1 Tax=Flavobacterium sp. TaxID=239 RepID=UPI001225CE2B|nr:hypothetical protein [Flavobacterium sp.]RZJ68614.1 MAG: hypothetical protein EOO50_00085 [Flavobacterium sp.]
MMKWLLILLVSTGCFAQRPLELILDSIKTDNSNPESRTFHLSYHITNNTNKPATFFLRTDHIVPVVASSMSHCPHYKLYQNGNSVDVSGIFSVPNSRNLTHEQHLKLQDSLREISSNPETWKKRMSESITKSKTTLAAGETRSFKIDLRWDRKRFQKNDENDYYLEPDGKFELELSMHLMRDELVNRMTANDYELALKDPDFIKGWFTSNRLPVDLSGQ